MVKKDYYKKSELKKIFFLAEKSISKEEFAAAIQDEVFNDEDFKRQILEVSIKLKLPFDVVNFVVKDFIFITMNQMLLVKKVARRINFFAFFQMNILEVKHNKYSIYNKKK